MKFVPVEIVGGPTHGQRVLFSVWDTRVQDYGEFARVKWITLPKLDFEQGPTHPVVAVSWENAKAFCAWLTARERASGRIAGPYEYRLPSDHEWSCAVGIGRLENADASPALKDGKIEKVYPWGTQWPPPKGSGNYAASLHADEFEYTSPVGIFEANENGLYDMGGNVQQWCEDWWGDAKHEYRALRGASWHNSDEINLRSANRSGIHPAEEYSSYGFRCVLAIPTQIGELGSKKPVVPAAVSIVLPPSATPVPRVETAKLETPKPPVGPTTTPRATGTVSVPPATATKAAPFANSLGMKFVPVPITGGPTDGQRVLFSVWDTRMQDYAAYAAENPNGNMEWKGATLGPTHPVVAVSWEDAKAFCAWLTKKERAAGKLGADQEYRLPSDHEWSCAVGIGRLESADARPESKDGKIEKVYPWGKQWPPPKGAGNYAALLHTDEFGYTSPVGSFAANENGLYDIGGNVHQWCEDWYYEKHEYRVFRGGSWFEGDEIMLRSSGRSVVLQASRSPNRGFRCVLVIPAQPAKTETPKPSVMPATTPRATGTVSVTPATATKAAAFENSLGMKFAAVGDVQFSVYPTTRKDFEAFATTTGLKSDVWRNPGFKQNPDHPVVNVTWREAEAFCKWLTDKERKAGLLKTGEVYRLPTDLEWSKAVGLPAETGGTPEERDMGVQDVYPWGTQWPPPAGAGNYAGEETDTEIPIPGYNDGSRNTSPVGKYRVNAFGLYDMGGNVWQWVSDFWNGENRAKTLRGGSWYNGAIPLSLLSSCRISSSPDTLHDTYGFRIVKGVEAGKAPPRK